MAKYVIKDDDSALKLLESLLKDSDLPLPEVEFKDWPRFEMHVKGERYHSTITPELMEAFLDLQKTINKSFALVRYADSSRRLTNADREELKILVHVAEGSSGFVAKLEEQAETLAKGIAEGFKTMDSRHKLIALLAIGVMGFGHLGFSNYLEAQKETRQAELAKLESDAEREERLKTLELFKGMDEAQAKRNAELFKMVTEKIPQGRSEVTLYFRSTSALAAFESGPSIKIDQVTRSVLRFWPPRAPRSSHFPHYRCTCPAVVSKCRRAIHRFDSANSVTS
ncbi:hypothetical protein ACLPJS_30320 [Pseudomonas aeruginosa]|uniref:hypothetical protein n=1 Tax=Pseudomonas aeruginosa TaxID=287 RepID=UPI003D278FA2